MSGTNIFLGETVVKIEANIPQVKQKTLPTMVTIFRCPTDTCRRGQVRRQKISSVELQARRGRQQFRRRHGGDCR